MKVSRSDCLRSSSQQTFIKTDKIQCNILSARPVMLSHEFRSTYLALFKSPLVHWVHSGSQGVNWDVNKQFTGPGLNAEAIGPRLTSIRNSLSLKRSRKWNDLKSDQISSANTEKECSVNQFRLYQQKIKWLISTELRQRATARFLTWSLALVGSSGAKVNMNIDAFFPEAFRKHISRKKYNEFKKTGCWVWSTDLCSGTWHTQWLRLMILD